MLVDRQIKRSATFFINGSNSDHSKIYWKTQSHRERPKTTLIGEMRIPNETTKVLSSNIRNYLFLPLSPDSANNQTKYSDR